MRWSQSRRHRRRRVRSNNKKFGMHVMMCLPWRPPLYEGRTLQCRQCGNAVVGEGTDRAQQRLCLPCDRGFFFARRSDLICSLLTFSLPLGRECGKARTWKRTSASDESVRRAISAAIGSTSSASAVRNNETIFIFPSSHTRTHSLSSCTLGRERIGGHQGNRIPISQLIPFCTLPFSSSGGEREQNWGLLSPHPPESKTGSTRFRFQ